VICFAKLFWYGPAGKALALVDALKRNGFEDVSMAGSAHIQEIVPHDVKFLNVDERSAEDIERLLIETEATHVIGSQNRFAIRAAKSQGIKSAFLDGLAWFWKDVPDEHLIADEIFWINFPQLKNRIPANKKVTMVPAVVEHRSLKVQKKKVIVHIGGCENPLTSTIPEAYLSLLAVVLNTYSGDCQILVAGGVRAVEYLEILISNPRVACQSLKHDDFLTEVSGAKILFTTAGMTATLEAFSTGVPVAFLPPTNLSQYALVNLLALHGAAPVAIRWSNYTPVREDISMLTEKDAISTFDEIAFTVANNEESQARILGDMLKSLDERVVTRGQSKFIASVGTDGADAVARHLYKAWHD